MLLQQGRVQIRGGLKARTGSVKARTGSVKAVVPAAAAARTPARRARYTAAAAAPSSNEPVLDVAAVAELIASRTGSPDGDEDRPKLERVAKALGITLGEAKKLTFRKRALLELSEAELASRVAEVAAVVGVPDSQARRMAAIQPALLLEPKRNGEALALGLRAICYELGCARDEAVQLILDNPSILHGREMHLSVADIAHLAMLREPAGRIASD